MITLSLLSTTAFAQYTYNSPNTTTSGNTTQVQSQPQMQNQSQVQSQPQSQPTPPPIQTPQFAGRPQNTVPGPYNQNNNTSQRALTDAQVAHGSQNSPGAAGGARY